MNPKFKYGQVWLVENKNHPTTIKKDHVQKKTRPMLIVSNNRNNYYAPTLNAIPLTSARNLIKGQYQLQYYWENSEFPQTVLCEQITTINKSDCLRYLYSIEPEIMNEIKLAMKIQLNI